MSLHRLSRPLLVLLPGLAIAVGGGPARAASIAPPGNSGVSQYFESVPSASGNQAPVPGSTAATGSAGRGSALSAATRRALNASGADGRAAAALAAANAPSAGSTAAQNGGGVTASPPAQILAPPSPVSPLPHGNSGSGGSGISPVLPVVAVIALLAAVALALLRRRGRTPPES